MIKMSVNMSPVVMRALNSLARKRGCTMTEVIRTAIGTEKYLDDAVTAGGTVLIEDRRERARQLVLRTS